MRLLFLLVYSRLNKLSLHLSRSLVVVLQVSLCLLIFHRSEIGDIPLSLGDSIQSMAISW